MLVALLAWGFILGFAAEGQEVAAARARLAELGRAHIQIAELPLGDARETYKKPLRDLKNPLLKEPRDVLLRAIDGCIRNGTTEERIGALAMYVIVTGGTDSPPDPSYVPVLLQILRNDDLQVPALSETVGWTLLSYPATLEIATALVETARRAPSRRIRRALLHHAAFAVNYDLEDDPTDVRQSERALADFEAWFDANRSRLVPDGEGGLNVRGSDRAALSRELRREERERIREDPVCVLRLLETALGGEEDERALRTMLSRCGAALFGEKAAAVLAKAAASPGEEAAAAELATAALEARGGFPVMDAVQLAAAYVAAYETDLAALDLARRMFDEFGSAEMARVLRGEPRQVRRKAREILGGEPENPED
jgi:hypothetical protein